LSRLVRGTALATVLVGIAAAGVMFTERVDHRSTRALDLVLALSRVQASVSGYVLMSQHGLLRDYDPIVAEMKRADQLIGELEAADPGMELILRHAFDEKAELLEQFKHVNAVYRNAVTIFSTELAAWRKAPPRDTLHLADTVRTLGEEVLAYHATGSAERDAAARHALEAVESSLRGPEIGQPHTLVPLTTSAWNILSKWAEQDTLVERLTTDMVPALLSAASARYLAEQRGAAAKGLRMRVGLTALAVLLLIGLVATLALLHARHRTLQRTLHDLAEEKTRVGTQKDELEQSLARLKEAREQLARSERLAVVGQLAAGVAHEINNPLAYVLSNLRFIREEMEALSRGRDEAALGELREALVESEKGSQRIQHIVRGLKAFSRVDEDTREPVDVREVVEGSLRMADHEIRHRCRLVKELGPVPLVEASEGRLGQVMLNLVLNAAQALDPVPGKNHEIRVVTRTSEEGEAIIEVHDTGCGIPEEHRARLFDPFFTTKPVGVGTGLGLSICHGIVSAVGGSIEVTSTVGVGSVFLVRLPPLRYTPVRRPEAACATPPRRPGRIIVVDDDPLVGKAIARRLARVHDVTTFERAADALRALEGAREADVILCDVMMPEIDGPDFCRQLQRRSPELLSRVVLMTGGAFTASTISFVAEGKHELLEKPIDEERLEQVIEARIQGRRAAAA
jgi:signal transduction histidine kinase/ActR/RegA family two-component response regulator